MLSVKAISVSGQQHGFVPLDKQGRVLAPVKLWCDTSTSDQCDEIMQAVGGESACIELTGNKILAGYTASKILAFHQSQPTLYDKLDCILLPHDYLNFWLTGEKFMEMGDASGTGFLDVKNHCWSTELLAAIDLDRDLSQCLPPLVKDNQIVGNVTQAVSKLTGLSEGIPVAIGGGDNMMGAIGTGNVQSGRVTISLGTSGTLYAYSDQPVIDNEGNIAAFCSSTGGWLPLLCTMNCTVTTELARRLFDIGIGQFDQIISAAPAGSEGVLTLPFFQGERTPNLPNAKGCILDLNPSNLSRQNLLRSAVESATYALRFGLDRIQELGVKPQKIVLTGGGANSSEWRQIVADIMGISVAIPVQQEGAAFGAALQAYCLLEYRGKVSAEVIDDHVTMNTELSCQPRDGAHTVYNQHYQRYQQAVSVLSQLY